MTVKPARLFLLGLCALLLAAAILLFPREKTASVTTYAMGSYIQQTLTGKSGAACNEAAARASRAVTDLEALLSWRVAGSEIDRLNTSSGPVALSPQTYRILEACLSVSEQSAGAFDPTVAPLSRLWDFDGSPRVPSPDELTAALALVDYRALSLPEENAAVLAEGSSLDLGAVGKGAACDAVLAGWESSGLSRGVVAVGGSVGLYGQKPGKKPWVVAVRDPYGSGSMGTLSLFSGCVSTSGSYEKTFPANGKTYHHLLDPKTGQPAETGLISVTVWRGERDGLDGALTDALSTACFVSGLEKSLPLLEHFHGEAVFLTAENTVFVTDGLKNAFSLTGEAFTLEDLP